MLTHKRRTGTRHVTGLGKSSHGASVKLAIYKDTCFIAFKFENRSWIMDWTMQSRDDAEPGRYFNGSGTKSL